jgi:amino acid transporter
LLDLGLLTGEERIGFRYWSPPYPLFREYGAQGWKGSFIGFWSTMISAAFAFGNVQIVAIAGAETRNPRKSIPAALQRTFIRVVLFYVLSIFVISLLVPANDPRLTFGESVTQSPFVIAFSRAGIKVSPTPI